jgi:hypothetical protein
MLFHAMMEFGLDLLRSKFWLINWGMVHYFRENEIVSSASGDMVCPIII